MEAEQEAADTAGRAAVSEARSAFETATALEMERRADLIEIRTRELQRSRDALRAEIEGEQARLREEEGAVPSVVAAEHEARLSEMDAIVGATQQRMERERADGERVLRAEFDAAERDAEGAALAKRVHAVTQVRQIRKAAQAKIKAGEAAWQAEAARWLFTAMRKIEAKKTEDAEEAAKKSKGKKKK